MILAIALEVWLVVYFLRRLATPANNYKHNKEK